MAHFDELMRRALTVRNNVAPSSNTAILVGGVLVSIVSALQLLLDTKQGTLTFDTTPTDGSTNPVTSDGIYEAIADAIASIDLSACEKIVNKVTAIDEQSTDVQYPSAKLLYDQLQALANIYAAKAETYTKTEVDNLIAAISTLSFQVVTSLPVSDIRTDVIYLVPSASAAQANIYDEYIYINNAWECIGSTAIDLSGYEQTTNKVTALSAQSTDTQYPSAKCVYDALQAVDLSACEKIVNKVTSLTAQATDAQYPSAKCVYDAIQDLYNLIYYYHAPTYYVRGTSSNAGGSETFTLQYKDDITGIITNVSETAIVDADGNFEFSYRRKKIAKFEIHSATLLTLDCSAADDFNEITNADRFVKGCSSLVSVDLSNATFDNVTILGARYQGMFGNCTLLTSVNLHNATFRSVTNAKAMFYKCSSLTSVDLSSATFESLITAGSLVQANDADNMFGGCTALVSLDLSAATFDSLQEANGMFHNCSNLQAVALNPNVTFSALTKANSMFQECASLISIDLSSATFDNLTTTVNMFGGCTALTTVNIANAQFSSLTNAGSARYQGMFYGCSSLTSVDLSSATFSELVSAQGLFYGCAALVSLDLSAATFEKLTDAGSVNYAGSGMFSGCTALASLDLSAATFSALQKNFQMFANCNALSNMTTSIVGTFPLSLDLRKSPLTYNSMVAFANWCKDLTGQTAQSVTFKTSAWNALSAAEQATITGIVTSKNWNLATA